jgi:hypothetical protein
MKSSIIPSISLFLLIAVTLVVGTASSSNNNGDCTYKCVKYSTSSKCIKYTTKNVHKNVCIKYGKPTNCNMACTKDIKCLKKLAGGHGCALYGPSKCSIKCTRKCLKTKDQCTHEKVCVKSTSVKICVQYRKCKNVKINEKVLKYKIVCRQVK